MVGMGYIVLVLCNYRPHPKDGEGNVFSLSTPGGGVSPAGGGQVSPAGGVRSGQPGGSGQSSRCGGVRWVQLGGGVSHPGGGDQSSQWGVSQDRSTEWVLTTRRAVCLLRSRRRTFLLVCRFVWSCHLNFLIITLRKVDIFLLRRVP